MRFPANAYLVTAGLSLVFIVSRADGAQSELEPGLWRLTLTSTTNGKSDPPQDSKECLGEELKDLAAYFAPQLEGGEAECERTQQPSKDRLTYRMHCRGAGFTVDALTGVTVKNSRHFTVTIQTHSRTADESATVVAKGKDGGSAHAQGNKPEAIIFFND